MRFEKLASSAISVASWICLIGLLLLLVAFRWIGESVWLVAILLYMPRAILMVPLAVLLPLVLRDGRRSLLLASAASWALLVPLMGLHLSLPHANPPESFRILSYNVWYSRRGNQAIAAEIERAHPDVVVFQATSDTTERYFNDYFPGWEVRSTGEFFIASRFPIRGVFFPPQLADSPRLPAGFVRYTLETSVGAIDLFNVHPASPRDGFETIRGESLRTTLKNGIPAEAPMDIAVNTEMRRRQIETLAATLARSPRPVMVAGDTNLPGLSAIYRRYLGALQDGFARVGNGFGYTFPANKLPWMRIDRVLASSALSFSSFHVGGTAGSDHCPVVAQIGRAD